MEPKNKISNLSDLSIERPVLAIVMSLIIVFAGILAFTKLPIREYPDIDPPVVTVTTVYPGASAKVIETEITDIIEEEISGVEGIRTLTSTSRDQVSSIVIEFVLERDIDIAAQDVRDKIARIRSSLPDNVDEPVIAKADSDAQPIVWVRVQSDSRDMLNLSEFTDREIKDYFQNIPGVSKVIFGGERRKSIQVLLDPKKLAYYNLTVIDIRNALKANNIELPAGSILSQDKQFSINVDAKLTTADQYGEIVLKQADQKSFFDNKSAVVKLKDVARVLVGAENDQSFVRFNGNQGFGLGIIRQSKSNALQISTSVRKLVSDLNKKIPKDIILDIGYDSAEFIRLSLEELYSSIWQATLFVLLVIFVFLRNVRSTLIPGLAIPISLIGVMIGIELFGFTVNQMTLLGLIISIGIVVDDSIIVLENIYRYIEEGVPPIEAAKKGAKEITLAVVATTLVLISIFLPIAFLKGVTGRLLSEFAFSLCFAVLLSAFVALTLAPMLCSKVFKDHAVKKLDTRQTLYKKLLNIFEQAFIKIEKAYEASLAVVLKIRGAFSFLTLIICVPLVFFLFVSIPKDFIPDEDRGTFLVVFQSPRGSNIEYLDKQVRKVENLLAKIPEVKTTIAVGAFGIGAPGKVTEGIVIARLKSWGERTRKVFAIVGPLYPQFFMMPETFTLPIIPKSGPDSGFGSQPIQLVIRSNDLNFLVKASDLIVKQSFSLPTILFAKSNLTLDKPELTVEINRDKALSLGISMEDISRSIELLFAGVDITEFNDNGEKYEVYVKLPRKERDYIRKIGEFAVRSKSGALVQLSNLISIKETVGAEELNHYNRKKSVVIEASPKAGITPVDGLNELEASARKILAGMENVPADVDIDYLGASKETKDSSSALYFGFAVALIFAYLFLAGQFESFLSPVIIMLSVPLALVGALLGLWFFQVFPFMTQFLISVLGPKFFWLQYVIPQFSNISINIYSQIGMIMLIGLSTKNGILLVEFMNQLRSRGASIDEAIVQAAKLRLRPILMTAIATIVGLLPIALALGVGTESRQSLGVVIITGLSVSTFVTLYLIPCVYRILMKEKNHEESFSGVDHLNHA